MVLIDCRNRNIRLLGLCCNSLPVAEKNTFRKSSRGGKDVLYHHFDLTVPHKGQLGRNSRGKIKQRPRMLFIGVLCGSLNLLFISPSPSCPVVASPLES